MNLSQARELVRHPGKFAGEHPLVPMMWHDLVLTGFAEEEGEFAAVRVGRWILHEDEHQLGEFSGVQGGA